MQIFFVDSDPQKCAQALCNCHVIKQVLESAQLLCTTHHYFNSDPRPDQYQHIKFYKKTHVNNPVTIWVRTYLGNYNWLAQHALALCNEYTYRYDKTHKSQDIITLCALFYPLNIDCSMRQTKPALAMPDQYKQDDPVQAYRNYYWYDKRINIKMTWKKRNPPDWWLKRLLV